MRDFFLGGGGGGWIVVSSNLEEYLTLWMIPSPTFEVNTIESEIALPCSFLSPQPNATLEKCSFTEISDAYVQMKEGIVFIDCLASA